MPKSSIKGAAFEYFVRRFMLVCGFKKVKSDKKLIYDFGPGQMIHGLGQPHNADVLVEPPLQTPFYNITRLIVECKCHEKPLGIDFVRNVLGLKVDINGFDIITPEILENRRNYRSKKPKVSDFERYNYQVALASFNGFKSSAYALAKVHKIPLISFNSTIFKKIKDLIFQLDNINLNDNDFFSLNKFLHDQTNNIELTSPITKLWYKSFIQEMHHLDKKINIGVTNLGTILFLYRDDKYIMDYKNENYYDGYQLHWGHNSDYWILHDNNKSYKFVLPEELLNDWVYGSVNINEYTSALDLKEKYLSSIVLYKNTFETFKVEIEIMKLSDKFIKSATEKLKKK